MLRNLVMRRKHARIYASGGCTDLASEVALHGLHSKCAVLPEDFNNFQSKAE